MSKYLDVNKITTDIIFYSAGYFSHTATAKAIQTSSRYLKIPKKSVAHTTAADIQKYGVIHWGLLMHQELGIQSFASSMEGSIKIYVK